MAYELWDLDDDYHVPAVGDCGGDGDGEGDGR